MILSRDDLVLLPSGRRALVLWVDRERQQVKVMICSEPAESAEIAIATALCRRIERGRPLPEPVRVGR